MLRQEKETTFVFNEEDKEASVWSASFIFQKKMAKLGIVPTRTDSRQDAVSHWYIIPKKWIKIRKPRVMTEKQRQKLVERGKLLAAHARKKDDP
jgi:hypothetical protein